MNAPKTFLLFLISTISPALIYAAEPRIPFTIEQVMSAPFASSPIASPAGGKVAWLMDERGQRNICIASAPEWKGNKVTSFAQDDGQEIADLAWAPDGTYLLFSRGGDFEMGRDNPNPALSPLKPEQAIWVAMMDGSPAKKLTEGHGAAISPKGDIIAFLRAGQMFLMKPSGEEAKAVLDEREHPSHLTWSPDGAELAFVSARTGHSIIGLYAPADKRLRYVDAGVDKDSEPVWSPDSTRLAYVRIPAQTRAFDFGPQREGEPWSIRITDVKTGFAREAFRAKKGTGSVFHDIVAEHQIFWAAGDRLIFPWEQTGWLHLYSLPAQGESATELTRGEGEVEHVAISADSRTIYYSTNIGDTDRRHLWSVDPSAREKPHQLTRGENIEWAPAPVGASSGLVFLTSSYNEPAHAAVRDSDGKTKPLAPDTMPSGFPSASLVRPQPVMITAADGLQIHGQLFLPPGRTPSERHPALIFFHGGSRRQMLLGFHYMGYYSNAYCLNQYFASQGYVVLSVNYRSGIGYGLDFREAIHYGATGASEFNDVQGAGLYLKSRPDVDPARIGVWGGSYGGYLTALALARASDLFAAGVDFHGVYDWNDVIENFVPEYDPKKQSDAAKIAFESSPLASTTTWKSPVLLIHGDDDRNVPFSQTIKLVEALRQQHVSFEELIIPNEIHDFLMHEHWLEAYKATADFFARKLRQGSS
ncbi:MAG: S9 family peptidase [Acidobacteriaceae bacterium]|nr:S9 family peptidase [Acidobacteriaceae bacterium]